MLDKQQTKSRRIPLPTAVIWDIGWFVFSYVPSSVRRQKIVKLEI
jgi:hypothetical protein